MQSSAEITELLIDWSKGNQEALDKLFPFVEKELRRLARSYMRKMRPGNTIQTTAVINETYLKLVDQNKVEWQNRAHFFGIAAFLMRQFLVNYIRDRNRKKRGGEFAKVEFDETILSSEKSAEILVLEHALCRLAEFDERKAKVVELRFYGGLSVSEIAEVLKISEITVSRDWNMAKAWLARQIRNEDK